MKILYFHQHFSTPKGTVGTRSYEMAKHLVKEGHSVKVVCGKYSGGDTGLTGRFINGKREGEFGGIGVIEFDLSYSNHDGFIKRSLTFAKFAIKSTVLVFREDYDVLFSTTTPLTAGIPGIVSRWLRRKVFVFEVRDLWPELPKEMGIIRNPIMLSLLSFLEWASYKSAHRCIGLSPGIVEGIKKRGVLQENITMIPNGCDMSLFGEPAEKWSPAGVNQNDFMAVFAGTHGVANGLDALIDVAIELQKRGRQDIKLVLVGQGKMKKNLESKADELKLDNIIFSAPVSKNMLSGLFARADIGMQLLANVPAFYYGTSPNKFFDYISAGLPVINNYPGWLAEIIIQNRCGYAVEANNAIAFVDALERADLDRVELSKMGIRAKKLARGSFSREALADEWVSWVTNVRDVM